MLICSSGLGCVTVTDEVWSLRPGRLIARPKEKDSLCVITARSRGLIRGPSENNVLAAAQLSLISFFTPAVDRKSFTNLKIQFIQKCVEVCTAELHLSVSLRPEAKHS